MAGTESRWWMRRISSAQLCRVSDIEIDCLVEPVSAHCIYSKPASDKPELILPQPMLTSFVTHFSLSLPTEITSYWSRSWWHSLLIGWWHLLWQFPALSLVHTTQPGDKHILAKTVDWTGMLRHWTLKKIMMRKNGMDWTIFCWPFCRLTFISFSLRARMVGSRRYQESGDGD